MNADTVSRAQKAADHFIECANAVQLALPKDPNLFYRGSPATGALRRASMDLTRALAELRKSTA